MKSRFMPVLSGVLACVIWGLSVFYYKFLDQIPPLEILAHRAFWSMVFFSIILLFRRESSKVFENILNWNSLRVYILATFLISINWFGFIFSIQVNQVTQSSFGYFVFPIVAVFLGFFFNKEKFSPLQTLSIILAIIAILLLGIGLGKFPFISILLATTFGFYGLIKGRISHNPIISVATETTLIAPIALLYLFYIICITLIIHISQLFLCNHQCFKLFFLYSLCFQCIVQQVCYHVVDITTLPKEVM